MKKTAPAVRPHAFSPVSIPNKPVSVRSGAGVLLLLPPPLLPSIHIPALPTSDSVLRQKSKQRELKEARVSSSLTEKVVGDVLVGCGVTFGVTPFLTVVDKAIVQRAAGTHSILQSGLGSIRSIVAAPLTFLKSPMFLVMWGTYAATYSTANSLKTFFEHQEYMEQKRKESWGDSSSPEPVATSSTSSKVGIFAGTAVVNSAASLVKDQVYARMFGTSSAAARVPMISYGLWAMRDGLVVGSSFLMPEMVSHTLQDYTNMDPKDALRVSQLACPVTTQFLVGPIHLLALDFYNRPLRNLTVASAAWERLEMLRTGAGAVIAARIARIAPGYGLGGVMNTHYRDVWRDFLIQREILQIEMEGDAGSQKEHANRLVELVVERHSACDND